MLYKKNSIVLESVFIQNNCVEILKAGTRIYNLKGTSKDDIKFKNFVGDVQRFSNVIDAYKNILHNNPGQIIEKYKELYFKRNPYFQGIILGYDDLLNQNEMEENYTEDFQKNIHEHIDSVSQKCCNKNCKHRGSKICGAHVGLQSPVRNIQIDDKFYIVPLCDSCNQEYYEPIILAYDVPAIVGIWDGLKR